MPAVKKSWLLIRTAVLVDKIADRVTRAVAADARDIDVLEKLGVENFDRAVVAVGSDLASSSDHHEPEEPERAVYPV